MLYVKCAILHHTYPVLISKHIIENTQNGLANGVEHCWATGCQHVDMICSFITFYFCTNTAHLHNTSGPFGLMQNQQRRYIHLDGTF